MQRRLARIVSAKFSGILSTYTDQRIMKILMYALFLSIAGISGLFYTSPEKPSKPATVAENKASFKSWQASPAGVEFQLWESSPTGKKVHAGAVKINRAIRGNASMEGVVSSLSLPEGSRVGYGFMVNIDGAEYMLAFGEEAENEFDELRGLQVNDKIIIKSHHVSKAPKYAYPILTASYVTQEQKFIFKRKANQGGC